MKVLLRTDAAIEAVLAVAFAVLAMTGPRSGGWATADWLSTTVLWTLSAAFATVALLFYAIAHNPRPSMVSAIGLVNMAGGIGVVVLSVLETANGSALRLAFGFAGVCIVVLGSSQARSAWAK